MFYKIDGQADAGWKAVPLGSISIAETGVYVIAACLPMYRSLLRRASEHLGSSLGGSRGTKGVYGSSTKSTELRSIGKSEKGFARLDPNEKANNTFIEYKGSADTSDEQLVVPDSVGDIQVQRSYFVSSQQK
jgi:hypothetical protein